jgi:hypothetical protein
LRVYHSRLDKQLDPRGAPYYWIGGDAPTAIPEYGTDAGALADMIILSENPLRVQPEAIKDIQVLVTIIGGKVEYCAAGAEELCLAVSQARPNILPFGFIYHLDTTAYKNGTHTIQAIAVNRAENKKPLTPENLTVTIIN